MIEVPVWQTWKKTLQKQELPCLYHPVGTQVLMRFGSGLIQDLPPFCRLKLIMELLILILAVFVRFAGFLFLVCRPAGFRPAFYLFGCAFGRRVFAG